jgi:hypothetical protein
MLLLPLLRVLAQRDGAPQRGARELLHEDVRFRRGRF